MFCPSTERAGRNAHAAGAALAEVTRVEAPLARLAGEEPLRLTSDRTCASPGLTATEINISVLDVTLPIPDRAEG